MSDPVSPTPAPPATAGERGGPPASDPRAAPAPPAAPLVPVGGVLAAEARAWFEWLHRHPELSFQERETAEFVAVRLRALGYTPREHVGVGPDGRTLYGVVAILGAERPGPALALRADLDALPLEEATGLAYASENPGAMHACGHDAHTAMLLGAAAAFKRRDAVEPFPGPIVFIFQPAEELPPGGALGLVEAGVLDHPAAGAIFGIHVGGRDVGTLSLAAGPRNAASDGFTITIRGKGGHAAWPHKAIDPVLVAAHVVVALQGIVSRQVSPRQAAVLTIGTINGGTKNNVIPELVTLGGTCRTLDPDLRDQMPDRIKAIVDGICAAFGAQADVDYRRGYDVVVNDAAMAELARSAAIDVVGAEFVQLAEPGMGGEDFGRYLQQVPGCFVTLGAGDPSIPPEERPGGHSPRFAVDPSCLPFGIAFYLALARRFFAQRGAA